MVLCLLGHVLLSGLFWRGVASAHSRIGYGWQCHCYSLKMIEDKRFRFNTIDKPRGCVGCILISWNSPFLSVYSMGGILKIRVVAIKNDWHRLAKMRCAVISYEKFTRRLIDARLWGKKALRTLNVRREERGLHWTPRTLNTHRGPVWFVRCITCFWIVAC